MKINNQNYELIFDRDVTDLDSEGYLLIHKKTGARVFILSNDDDNKVFMIGFRTPPNDSTGVAHITEHSVLCGSDKYPLKDPFVELAKGSLNTFLNAMTYPDKTVYPVASRNDQDFKNLMSVYMDAVFHPNTYKYPEILKQEGWNYKIDSPEDPIEYNGVVYNEMKGAFSTPDGVLEREVLNSLFPDTAYGVESGGDPDVIPDLTYDAFLDFHRKYYHPSNSYIYLYGNMDIEERLAWLDREYLRHYDRQEVDSEIRMQMSFDEMREIRKPYPITDDEDEEDNAYLAYSFVCGDNLDAEKDIAVQMILYALVDMPGAPVRKRLLDEGIGKDISSLYEDDVLQPFVSIEAKNANESQKERFLEIINEEFNKAAEQGLDRKSLLASLNSIEFRFREGDFGGAPKGLIYGLDSLSSWLYDDYTPFLNLELGKVFDTLREAADTDYFENILKEYFIYNTHVSLVVLYPQKGLSAEKEAATAKKLADFKASLSDEEILALVDDSKALAKYQEEPSDEEALETIPLLERKDLNRVPEEFRNKPVVIDGMTLVEHEYQTNGIIYCDIMFDVSDIKAELLPYLGLLRSVVSYVDTENYTYSDLSNEINFYLGSLSVYDRVIKDARDTESFSIKLVLSFKTLAPNLEKGFELAEEVLTRSRFDDDKRLYEIIAELKSKLQMSMSMAGHSTASGRVVSYFSPEGKVKDILSGVGFYEFVEDLEENFEDRKDDLKAAFSQLMRKFVASDRVIGSATLEPEMSEAVGDGFRSFKEALDRYTEKNAEQGYIPCTAPVNERSFDFAGSGLECEQKNEAFKTSGTVNYVARAGRYFDDIKDYDAAIQVFHTIMRYEYLWFNIRVQGGAYGCMSGSSSDGKLTFATYRDPNIRRSNDVFEGIAGYIEDLDIDDREMTKFVIGTMSSVDPARTVCEKGTYSMTAYLANMDYEKAVKNRNRIIDCTQEDIRSLAPGIRKAMEEGNICCVGSESGIEKDADLFKQVKNGFSGR